LRRPEEVGNGGEIRGKPAVTVWRDTTVQEATHRMRFREVGALVVADRTGTPVGILTDRDITMHVSLRGSTQPRPRWSKKMPESSRPRSSRAGEGSDDCRW
jgi:CBS domain-containing protein